MAGDSRSPLINPDSPKVNTRLNLFHFPVGFTQVCRTEALISGFLEVGSRGARRTRAVSERDANARAAMLTAEQRERQPGAKTLGCPSWPEVEFAHSKSGQTLLGPDSFVF